MSFGYDPELPAGYQEADLEMAAFEEQAARARALRKRGICTHSWVLGAGSINRRIEVIEADRKKGHFPERPTDPSITCQNDIPNGKALCLDCGKIIDDPLERTP